MKHRCRTVAAVTAWFLCLPGVSSLIPPLLDSATALSSTAPPFLLPTESPRLDTTFLTATTSTTASLTLPLLGLYMNSLTTNPLPTKMATGALLAVAGDAIAQTHEPHEYDKRRAVSFAVFDMCYRALQHVAFPIIVQHCHGQYIHAALQPLAAATAAVPMIPMDLAAATEQTLASQLGIVPFLYYPVFFALTGVVQRLTPRAAWERAQQNFFPLMERNLLFWIPIQFIQFSFIQENLQIPFLSVCGLCWTFILSVMAGSTKEFKEEEPYCVIGLEEGCIVPDDLFPHTTPEAIGIELQHELEEITHEIQHEVEVISHVFDRADQVETPEVATTAEVEAETAKEAELALK